MVNAATSMARDLIRSRVPSMPEGVPDYREELAEVVANIAERFRPERGVLFGSRASGRADAESDIDVMVVKPTPRRPIDEAVAIARAIPHHIALDILVRTPEQIAVGIEERDFFKLDVMNEGVTLFEAGDAGLDRSR